jgi:nucleotide-binding universal stress UspA family protein
MEYESRIEEQSRIVGLRGPVLVATDLGPGSDEALRQGHALANGLGGPLHVCHVMPDLLTVRMLFPQVQQRDDAAVQDLERHAGDLVRVSVERLTGRSPREFRAVIESGSPHSGILRHAETMGAGVIVVGAGSVAERVVRYARSPVLVARPCSPGVVLAATDFSDSALPAVAAGAAEANRRGVGFAVLHSLDFEPVMMETYGGAYAIVPPLVSSEERARFRAETLQALQRALALVGAEGAAIVTDGAPGTVILEAARTLPAELVVVGTTGRTGLSRLALGSVAEAVVRWAPCSILVMRRRAA